MTQVLADDVEECHSHHEQQDDGTDIDIDELANDRIEFLPDAAGTNKANDRGGTHVDFKTQQDVASEVREHLRHHRIAHDLAPVRAYRPHCLYRPGVNVFAHLRKELAQTAARVDGNGEDARQRTETKGIHKHQGIDQLGDRASNFQNAPTEAIYPDIGRQIAGCGKAQHDST